MPRGSKAAPDQQLLQAALEGLELQRGRIEEQIRQVQSMLGQRSASRRGPSPAKKEAPEQSASASATRKRRPLSAAARKRIAAAQKRRWAEFRKKEKGE